MVGLKKVLIVLALASLILAFVVPSMAQNNMPARDDSAADSQDTAGEWTYGSATVVPRQGYEGNYSYGGATVIPRPGYEGNYTYGGATVVPRAGV